MKALVLIVTSVLVIIAIAAGVLIYVTLLAPAVPEDAITREFMIHRGMSLPQIADSLAQQGLIASRERFIFADRLLGWGTKLKAGKYTIAPGTSTLALYKMFRDGKAAPVRVTLPEGRTIEDFAGILRRALDSDSTAFVRLTQDSAFVQSLGLPVGSLEGFLYPNTYNFFWGTSPKEIIRTMVQAFHRHFDDSLRQRAAELGMTLSEVVTLASIIEGEAVVDSERAVISAVYHNRLRRGMLLQADPTIQYIVPGPPRRLLNRDLDMDSPYNTYRYPGLPPGPVNNPGIASIRAALYPAQVNYLYFVARGDGTHSFSHTLNEHLRAKREFDKVRARVRQQKPSR